MSQYHRELVVAVCLIAAAIVLACILAAQLAGCDDGTFDPGGPDGDGDTDSETDDENKCSDFACPPDYCEDGGYGFLIKYEYGSGHAMSTDSGDKICVCDSSHVVCPSWCDDSTTPAVCH